MFDKRCCRLVWALTILTVGFLALWQLTGCPGPPAPSLSTTSRDHRRGLPTLSPARYQPLLPNNVSTVPDPYPVHSLPSTDVNKLIDLEEFSFITTSSLCNNSSAPLIITLVHSAPSHVKNRKRIRLTWGQPLDLVFLVGETNSTIEKELLEAEIKEFGDIVQGTFQDTYRNLTYKHTMGLKWVAYHCPRARYILKTDDDIFVNTPYLLDILKNDLSPLGGRRLILCNVMEGVRAKRTYRSKWRVSPEEYAERWYPNYCAGWVILYTPDVAFTLYSAAQRTPYFWIDDVHITGNLVARTNFTHTNLGQLSQINNEKILEILDNGGPVEFLFSLLTNQYFTELWDLVIKSEYYNSFQNFVTHRNKFKSKSAS